MYSVKLIDKKEVAVGTMAFTFEKPVGYVYKAGQHTAWTLIDPPETDAEGDGREFSFASGPHEENLLIASRMRDTAFKRVLHNLALGTEIEIGEPEGSFVLHQDFSRPAVFLAGGIGITPFHSMILDAAFKKLPHQIFLFYSNRTAEEAPFLDELQNVTNPNYKFIPIFTKTSGHLTKDLLSQSLGDLITPIYFIAGPPQFVLGMKDILSTAGVDDLSIKSEDFEGY